MREREDSSSRKREKQPHIRRKGHPQAFQTLWIVADTVSIVKETELVGLEEGRGEVGGTVAMTPLTVEI